MVVCNLQFALVAAPRVLHPSSFISHPSSCPSFILLRPSSFILLPWLPMPDQRTLGLVGGVLIVLLAATVLVQALRRRPDAGINAAILETFRLRVHAWWVLCSVLAAAFIIGKAATVVMFGLIAFWALREFITLTPTRPGDHRTLFWVFFLLTPLQFVLVGMAWYEAYQHRHSRLRVPLRPCADRHCRRLQAFSGADGEDSGRAADLRLLPQPRPGAVDAATAAERRRTVRSGGQRPAVVLLRAYRATQRRLAVRLVADSQPARHRPVDQPDEDLGRAARAARRA